MMPKNNVQIITGLYERFNARDIDGVLAALTNDVAWANAMEGGHAHGHVGVRDYWTRQWAIVSHMWSRFHFGKQRMAP